MEFHLQHQSFQGIFGLIPFRIEWFYFLAVQGTLKSLLQHHTSKASILWHSVFFTVQLSHPYEEISSLSHSVVFLYILALIPEEGFLISSCYSLELCIQMGISPFLLCFLLLFLSQLFVRPPQTAILLFSISFSWGWS